MTQPIDKDALLDRLQKAGITRTFTIAFSPRCGSTVLSNALTSAGFGRPTEYFQYPYSPQSPFGKTPSNTFWQDFEALVTEHSSNGIFGSKMMHDHRAHLDDWLAGSVSGYTQLDDVLPNHRWIYVRREDTIAQAVSLFIADETGLWHIPTGDAASTPAPDVQYDFFAILTKLMILHSHDANWDIWFHKMSIAPLRTTYERILAAPDDFLAALAVHSGLPAERLGGIQLSRCGGLHKITDSFAQVYSNIRERFTADFLDIGRRNDRDRLGPGLERWIDFFGNRRWKENEAH
ncbi:Stf0 family sulfotransferase [Paraburkholderia dokdonensis]|uniref:Stf0 family sulfotransferase n=1 Tax=Paraburkholderia dokdonensis TaxID=2211211 RepID=UPI00135B5141|nr:Stf0 family sulfotransferase [Paraburkholderia dokdonensis]